MSKKRRTKQKNNNRSKKIDTITEKYSGVFSKISSGKTYVLKDKKSAAGASFPIKAVEDIYVAAADGALIPDSLLNQKKCDYVVYCDNIPQSCFIELKGKNISQKKGYNPYTQITETIEYLKQHEDLNFLARSSAKRHAFIVSPEQQTVPRHLSSAEKKLFGLLATERGTEISDVVHYVRVLKKGRYSDRQGRIICSQEAPVGIPYSSPSSSNDKL